MRGRVVEGHTMARQGECVLQLGAAPRFLSLLAAAGEALRVFIEDDFNPRPREPWTVVAVTGDAPVPERAMYVGSAEVRGSWYHAYAYRGAPRKEQA